MDEHEMLPMRGEDEFAEQSHENWHIGAGNAKLHNACAELWSEMNQNEMLPNQGEDEFAKLSHENWHIGAQN